RAGKCLRQDSDHGARTTVDQNLRSENRRFEIMSGPVRITHDRDVGIASRCFFFRQKNAATQWRDAENCEVIRRNNVSEYTTRVSFLAQSAHADVVRGDSGKNGILLANVG